MRRVVDVCPRDGEAGAFQAQSVDVSGRGMHLRSDFPLEIDGPLLLRLHDPAGEVLAEGELVWRAESQGRWDFGVRFTALDSLGVRALKQICSTRRFARDRLSAELTAAAPASQCRGLPARLPSEPAPRVPPRPGEAGEAAAAGFGRAGPAPAPDDDTSDTERSPPVHDRVSLIIEGLPQPLRADVRGDDGERLVVGSALEFLSVGRHVRVEDCSHGRPKVARIGEVGVSVDPESRIPQLVVSVDYQPGASRPPRGPAATPEAPAARASGDDEWGFAPRPSSLPGLRPPARPASPAPSVAARPPAASSCPLTPRGRARPMTAAEASWWGGGDEDDPGASETPPSVSAAQRDASGRVPRARVGPSRVFPLRPAPPREPAPTPLGPSAPLGQTGATDPPGPPRSAAGGADRSATRAPSAGGGADVTPRASATGAVTPAANLAVRGSHANPEAEGGPGEVSASGGSTPARATGVLEPGPRRGRQSFRSVIEAGGAAHDATTKPPPATGLSSGDGESSGRAADGPTARGEPATDVSPRPAAAWEAEASSSQSEGPEAEGRSSQPGDGLTSADSSAGSEAADGRPSRPATEGSVVEKSSGTPGEEASSSALGLGGIADEDEDWDEDDDEEENEDAGSELGARVAELVAGAAGAARAAGRRCATSVRHASSRVASLVGRARGPKVPARPLRRTAPAPPRHGAPGLTPSRRPPPVRDLGARGNRRVTGARYDDAAPRGARRGGSRAPLLIAAIALAGVAVWIGRGYASKAPALSAPARQRVAPLSATPKRAASPEREGPAAAKAPGVSGRDPSPAAEPGAGSAQHGATPPAGEAREAPRPGFSASVPAFGGDAIAGSQVKLPTGAPVASKPAPKLTPVFSRGRLRLPIIHRIRLDAPADGLRGRATPTGFVVDVPGRRALDSGKSIVRRDPRVAKVTTEQTEAGARITLRFQRAIVPYKVRLKQQYVEVFISQ